MIFLLAAALAVILAVVALILAKLKAKPDAENLAKGSGANYELRSSLFTPAERSFAGVLENALPDGVGMLAKVRLGDVFKARKGLTPSERTKATNRIDRKHVDFLLVRTTDLAPVAGIELDDSSHERADRQARDAFVDELFASCQIPLLHVPAQAAYNLSDVKRRVTALTQTRSAA